MVKRNFNNFDDYNDDAPNDALYHSELRERRKNKRMRNALRSKNIRDLMYESDDDEDWY
jgi:hypothetical protein